MSCLFLNLYQARQTFAPDLDPNRLTLRVFSKECFEKDDFEKKSADQESLQNYLVGKQIRPKLKEKQSEPS